MNSPLITVSQSATPVDTTFFIVGIIAFIIWIAYIIRLWFVQTATFNIEKDVADIRDHLLGLDAPTKDVKPSIVAELKDYVPEEERKERVNESIAKNKPRPFFLWLMLLVPIALVIVVIINATA